MRVKLGREGATGMGLVPGSTWDFIPSSIGGFPRGTVPPPNPGVLGDAWGHFDG